MPERPDPTAGRLVASQAAARDRITANLLVLLVRPFRRLLARPSVRDEDLAAFAADAARLVAVGQAQTARASATYMRTVLARTPGVELPDPTPIQLPTSLRGVSDPTTVYQRPYQQYRRELARDVDTATAATRAERRLAVIADTDLTMAMREATRQVVANLPRVIGMRRVIHPELSRGGSCGLCVAASDRLYSPRELLPIHARCNCEALPVTETHDPGQALNAADLRRLYADAGDTTAGAALKRTRYRIETHGEYGPVLVRADDSFRGPDDLAA